MPVKLMNLYQSLQNCLVAIMVGDVCPTNTVLVLLMFVQVILLVLSMLNQQNLLVLVIFLQLNLTISIMLSH